MNESDSPEVLARVRLGLELVQQIARQFTRILRDAVEFDDLVGYGQAGLLAAARRFDPERGVPFEPYASFRVRGAMLDGIRGLTLPRRTYERLRAAEAAHRFSDGMVEQTFIPRFGPDAPSWSYKFAETMAAMSTAVAMGIVAETRVDEGELVSIDHSNPEQHLEDAQLKDLVVKFIDELPPEEQQLVRRHYLKGERFDRVAADLKISKSWASRLHTRAIGRLSRRLRSVS